MSQYRCPGCGARVGGSVLLMRCRMCEKYFCPNCQGRTIFTPKCPYCGSVEFRPAQREQRRADRARVVEQRKRSFWARLLGRGGRETRKRS